jgi:hypothetical protein
MHLTQTSRDSIHEEADEVEGGVRAVTRAEEEAEACVGTG